MQKISLSLPLSLFFVYLDSNFLILVAMDYLALSNFGIMRICGM